MSAKVCKVSAKICQSLSPPWMSFCLEGGVLHSISSSQLRLGLTAESWAESTVPIQRLVWIQLQQTWPITTLLLVVVVITHRYQVQVQVQVKQNVFGSRLKVATLSAVSSLVTVSIESLHSPPLTLLYQPRKLHVSVYWFISWLFLGILSIHVRILYKFGGKFANFNEFYNGYERKEQLSWFMLVCKKNQANQKLRMNFPEIFRMS